MYKHWILALLAAGAAAVAQTQVDLGTQSKDVDFSQAPSTRPVKTGSALPTPCVAGQLFYLTTAPAGQNLYGCTNAATWALEAGGGSGGAQGASQLTDLQLTLTSGTVLTIGANCAAITPCNVLVNGVVTQFLAPATVTNSASAGLTARVYVSDASDGNSAGTLVVANSASSGLTCSGCTVMNSTVAFPASGVALGSWTALAVAGQWDAAGGTDFRGWLGGSTRLLSGSGNCSVTPSAAGTTIACGTGIVPSTRGAFASVPVCNANIAGQLYFASPSSGLSAQCNGTAWQWYAGGDQITPPPAAAGFTVVNGAVLADSNGSLTATAATGTDTNLRAGLLAAGAATTYTVGYKTNNYDGSNFATCGLVLSNGTTNASKYMLWGDASSGPAEYYYGAGYAGGVTSFFTSAASPFVMNLGTIRWRRITIGGGNIAYLTSPDGQNWVAESHSNTVAGTLTPAFYGFGCDPRGGPQTYGAVVVSLSAQ
ncbi:MAG TPA: hypothetical protein VGR73_09970 [Bryobacteraceae bacterium]|nr:hypothetical protein [Bryobacteraceae bacterium]